MFTKRLTFGIFSLFIALVLTFSTLGVTPADAIAGIVVNSSADVIADDSLCTLREAITNANGDSQLFATAGECPAGSGADTITFAAKYTITLVGSQLPAVTTAITINGNGEANTIIEADAAPNTATYRVVEVGAAGNLTLNSLTVRNGRCSSCATNALSGGGVYNAGTLTASNVTFSANSVIDSGGGMYNATNSSSTLTNVTFSGNSAGWGGGMYNISSSPTLTNVTFSANFADQEGGGMENYNSSPTLTNVTFSGNSASLNGGGMYNYSSNPTLTNVIIANSVSGGDCHNNSSTLNAASSNNLIKDAANACGLTNAVNGNIIGSDPKLGVLSNNGSLTQIMALSAGSPAIDAGVDLTCPATDQRGVIRPQGSHCDIGAYEYIDPSLVWNTFLGGNGSDVGNDIIVDGSGNIYVTGYSTKTWGNPVRPHNGNDNAFNGDYDAFVAKFSSSGALIWNTFLGGPGWDFGNGITLDVVGNVYVTGSTDATWGSPVTGHAGNNDAFVVKLDSSGVMIWNTFVGGSASDYGNHIAVDVNGNIYIAGDSSTVAGTDDDGFASKLNSSGEFQWTTVLGGGWVDEAVDIAVDANQNIYVLGNSITTWGDNPLRSFSNGYDAFVAKLNSLDGALSWHTFLGGNGYDKGNSIFLDGSGNIYVAGESNASWETPVRAYSVDDAFAVKLDTSGGLIWNTFLGGNNYDIGTGIAVDKNDSVYLSGVSYGTWGNPLMAYSGGSDGFAVKLNSFGVLTSNTFLGGNGHNRNGDWSASDSGYSVTVDQSGYAYVTGMSYDTWGNPISAFTVSNDGFVAKVKLATFADVSSTFWSWEFIERLYNAGITSGCITVPLSYCPTTPVTRAQMAIFLLRGMHGSTYTPPAATGTKFNDVPLGTFGAAWIEQLAVEGITSGCGAGNYCPTTPVSRAQMAIFLVRAKHGIAFTPPTATGLFTDVPVGSFGADYIEQLSIDAITSGCGGTNYCPNTTVKRDSMAVFLVKTFNLP